jgi:prepilin-type N-terminal cleavage/methylation domain-containing protein
MLKQPCSRSARPGFTLVELLIVMSIILILVAAAVPAVNTARNKAKDTEVKSGCNTIQKALEQYAVDHSGFYPGAHWVTDSTGTLHVGPGVVGATPTLYQGRPQDDFSVPSDASDARQPYLADGVTPNPDVLDDLIINKYLSEYPPNPFIRTGGGARAQMTNLFLFRPQIGSGPPDPAVPSSLDWNKLTTATTGNSRVEYDDLMRGHFSYIPLNPVNLAGEDFIANWTTLPPAELAEYYKRCRGYMLVGWGHNRIDDTQAKGLSEKFWSPATGGFDFDKSLDVDGIEAIFSQPNDQLITPEMRDSGNSAGAYGQNLMSGAKNIDPAFFGSSFIYITGS